MTTLEIAIKYGVPIPETCNALGWQNETLFYWIPTQAGEQGKIVNYSLCIDIDSEWFDVNEKCVIDAMYGLGIPAPQMHEIASIIPEKYLGMYSGRIGDVFINSVQSDSIDVWIDFDMYVDVKNHHYSQALAELYLKLKEKNLLNL